MLAVLKVDLNNEDYAALKFVLNVQYYQSDFNDKIYIVLKPT